jgi:hypothetical protein
MSEMNLLIVAVVAVGAGILLIKFGQVIARFLLVLGGLIVAAIIGLAFLEQARATRAVATTASIAATGQAATSASLAGAVILILFLLVAGGGVAAYLYLRRQRQRPRWLPGPNAYWGQVGTAPGSAGYPLPAPPAYPYPMYFIPPQPYSFPYPMYPYPQVGADEEDNDLALPWWE